MRRVAAIAAGLVGACLLSRRGEGTCPNRWMAGGGHRSQPASQICFSDARSSSGPERHRPFRRKPFVDTPPPLLHPSITPPCGWLLDERFSHLECSRFNTRRPSPTASYLTQLLTCLTYLGLLYTMVETFTGWSRILAQDMVI